MMQAHTRTQESEKKSKQKKKFIPTHSEKNMQIYMPDDNGRKTIYQARENEKKINFVNFSV